MKPVKKYTAIIESGKIEERQIISLRSLINRDKEAAKAIFEAMGDRELSLTDEQNEKGKTFLLGLWKTDSGRERKNNPFGYREQKILEGFSHFTLSQFYNAGNAYVDSYLPVYSCYSKDGNGFEYYYQAGEVHIIG